MAKDYKHRVQLNKTTNDNLRRRNVHKKPQANLGLLRWMLATGLVIGFAVFVAYMYSMRSKSLVQANDVAVAHKLSETLAKKPTPVAATNPTEPEKKQPPTPRFDFYTILPKKEVVIADHEIKARVREERVGKVKPSHYVIQVGSFKKQNEAEVLRGKLAAMGIASRIHKVKVENVTWYRVKLGPYIRLESVNNLMARLQVNGMRPVVTELESLE